MAAEHYCEKHNVPFTRKTNKDGDAFWSHQSDEGWCNEPKSESKPKPSAKPDTMSKDEWADKDKLKSSSIEAQNAYTGGVQLLVAGIVKREETLGQTIINYAMSKLSNWASMGETQNKPPKNEGMATADQLRKIFSTSEEKGYAKALSVALLVRLYDVGSSPALTKTQADDFIKILSEGRYLGEAPATLNVKIGE